MLIEGISNCLRFLENIADLAEQRLEMNGGLPSSLKEFSDEMNRLENLCCYGNEIIITDGVVDGYIISSGEYSLLKFENEVFRIQIVIPYSLVEYVDDIICNL